MELDNNVTTDVSEWQHISNVKVALSSFNKVNYINHVLRYNEQCASLDYVVQTQLNLTGCG
jgi:hypothetical protein